MTSLMLKKMEEIRKLFARVWKDVDETEAKLSVCRRVLDRMHDDIHGEDAPGLMTEMEQLHARLKIIGTSAVHARAMGEALASDAALAYAVLVDAVDVRTAMENAAAAKKTEGK